MYLATQNPITRLYFLRHARTAHNETGVISSNGEISLDKKGFEQADQLAQRMKQQFPVDVVYSSPLKRTKQTAKAVAEAFNLEVSYYEDLIEFSFGKIAGMKFDEVKAVYPDLYRDLMDWSEAPNDGSITRPVFSEFEPMEVLQARIKRFTERILAENAGKRVAVITHGGLIKCCMHYYAGGSFDRKMPFFIDNTSISIVDFYKGNATIRLVNDISHTGNDLKLSRPLPL